MKLSSLSRNGLKVMAYLATIEDSNKTTSISELANIIYAPKPFLEKVILRLKNANLLVSERGKDGGYKLARPADKISVGEVLRVLENDLVIAECKFGCTKQCLTKDVLINLQDMITDYLDKITLKDMTKKGV